MSRENTKIDFFIKIWYSYDMKSNDSFDFLIWKSAQEGEQDSSSRKDFEFYFQNQKVGKCSVFLYQNAFGIYGDNQFLPEHWFYEEKEFFNFPQKAARLKPFMEIGKLDFSEFQGKGFGRMALQKIVELAQNSKAEGRITLDARKQDTSLRDPVPFYEHCGFKGNEGESGRKYFDPTPRSMHLLFLKEAMTDFKMVEVPIQQNENSIIDTKTGAIRCPKVLKEALEKKRN